MANYDIKDNEIVITDFFAGFVTVSTVFVGKM